MRHRTGGCLRHGQPCASVQAFRSRRVYVGRWGSVFDLQSTRGAWRLLCPTKARFRLCRVADELSAQWACLLIVDQTGVHISVHVPSPHSATASVRHPHAPTCVLENRPHKEDDETRPRNTWTYVGRHRSHGRSITGLEFGTREDGRVSLVSVGEDRCLVEYNLPDSNQASVDCLLYTFQIHEQLASLAPESMPCLDTTTGT